MRRVSSVLLLLATPTLLALAGCKGGGDEPRGMPAASAWKPPAAIASEVEGGRGAPATPGDDDPHPDLARSGGDRGGSHAGPTGDQDPHANLDMDTEGAVGPGEDGGPDPAMANLKPPDPDRPIDPNKVLRGTIRAGKAVADAIKPGSVLFLSAWPIDPATEEVLGAPVAVAKMAVEALPMKFELSERDVMVDGTRFDGEVMVRARVDGDGEARTSEPGDVEGRVRARVPASGVDLVLDTAVP